MTCSPLFTILYLDHNQISDNFFMNISDTNFYHILFSSIEVVGWSPRVYVNLTYYQLYRIHISFSTLKSIAKYILTLVKKTRGINK